MIKARLLAASVVHLVDLLDDCLSDFGSSGGSRLGSSCGLSDLLDDLSDENSSLASFLIITLTTALEPGPDLGQDSDGNLEKTKGSANDTKFSDPEDESLGLTLVMLILGPKTDENGGSFLVAMHFSQVLAVLKSDLDLGDVHFNAGIEATSDRDATPDADE
jgi:hypothetical protein